MRAPLGYSYIFRVDTRDFACIQRTGAFLTKKSWICYAYPGYELVKHKFGGSIPDTHDKNMISLCASPAVVAHDYAPQPQSPSRGYSVTKRHATIGRMIIRPISPG